MNYLKLFDLWFWASNCLQSLNCTFLPINIKYRNNGNVANVNWLKCSQNCVLPKNTLNPPHPHPSPSPPPGNSNIKLHTFLNTLTFAITLSLGIWIFSGMQLLRMSYMILTTYSFNIFKHQIKFPSSAKCFSAKNKII